MEKEGLLSLPREGMEKLGRLLREGIEKDGLLSLLREGIEKLGRS